ncbi:type 1 fimbrial protein [Pseudomonas sp. PB120]|uniref:type 1 fimbrial protein n=1 Tax=Pseudomonas sp. PB120 TaxID=2494700 RepID=UPI0012FDE781|nr:type 1 fimbrial protein [Pseudomonas sp. PB120]MVV49339.1 type 1 fimbrial protein [Pseudomonas sp. PB120]
MNGKQISVCISLFLALKGTCLAAAPPSGTVQFHGSIVEPGCTSRASTQAAFELNGCPFPGHAVTMKVNSLGPVIRGHGSVNVKRLADSGQKDRYYDSQYELVDGAGKPVRSGMYLITLSMP